MNRGNVWHRSGDIRRTPPGAIAAERQQGLCVNRRRTVMNTLTRICRRRAGACWPRQRPRSPPTSTRSRFGTNWLAEAEHGGYYQAVADGTYAKYGLDVTIVQGGPQAANQAAADRRQDRLLHGRHASALSTPSSRAFR